MACSTERGRIIYDYHRVLDTLVDETEIHAYRLFRVMFPLHQVTVRGQGRRAEDYEELEWFTVQAVGYAQIESVAALCDFYGLDERLERYIVEALKAIGHLVEKDDGKLVLTSLGRESLADERRYEIYESHQVLYFDAFTCHPLPRKHYRLRFLAPSELEREQSLLSFTAWRPGVLDELARRPDRAEYNVPDEVETLESLDVGSAYLPIYLLEVRDRDGKSAWRAFSNVRGRRDLFIESLVADHSVIVSLLLDDPRSPREAIGQSLESRGWPSGSYRLDRGPTGEWRATVPKRWMESLQSDGKVRLSDVGEHIRVASYCVLLWSDVADIRHQAACIRVLETLERARRIMSPSDVQQHIQRVFSGLALPAPNIGELVKMARKRGWEQAIERMENLG